MMGCWVQHHFDVFVAQGKLSMSNSVAAERDIDSLFAVVTLLAVCTLHSSLSPSDLRSCTVCCPVSVGTIGSLPVCKLFGEVRF